jgi:hypothetical protein
MHFGAELLRGLGLVESLQLAVVPLVQRGAALDRQVSLPDHPQDDVERLDGALQLRRVGAVEAYAAQRLAGALSLAAAGLGQRNVDPAGEAVLQIPLRFAVPYQDQQRPRLPPQPASTECPSDRRRAVGTPHVADVGTPLVGLHVLIR